MAKSAFFWVEKSSKKKSYVLGKDPFDGVYKGDCLEKIVRIDPGSAGPFFDLVEIARRVRVSPPNGLTPAPDKKIAYYIKRRPKAAWHVGGPYMDKRRF